ncbi:MAG: hypothetical protein F6J93_37965 [Oscillatoria sp. SIO1A7]|nr:hypothetical protein [Oscillatoria sp. SIO1A7]
MRSAIYSRRAVSRRAIGTSIAPCVGAFRETPLQANNEIALTKHGLVL